MSVKRMKKFVIFTTKYEAELRKFAATAAADEMIYIEENEHSTFLLPTAEIVEQFPDIEWGEKNKKNATDGFAASFAVARRDAFCEALLRFLMDIAENQNPVYRQSTKLRAMAGKLRDGHFFAQEKRRLGEFLRGTRWLVLEGYIAFRMTEFCEKLDMMMYSLVKKIKFGLGE